MTTTRQLLQDTFWIDSRALNEARSQKRIEKIENGRYRIRGVKGQHCGIVNRNNRIYPAETTWGRHTVAEAEFAKKVRARRVIGQLEHPQDGKSSMGMGAVVITECLPPDPKTGEVFITFETMSTPAGRIVGSYIEDGVGFGLSSRGNGSVISKQGVDEVQEDFEPITFDCVIDESTPGAEVTSSKLKEARHALVEAAGGDLAKAAALADEQTQIALARDAAAAEAAANENMAAIPGGDAGPPSNNSGEYLLSIADGSGHYRAYDNGARGWDVWLHVHNLAPKKIAGALQTLRDARGAAENHLHNVVGESAPIETDDDSRSESYSLSSSLPYMGTMLKMVFDSATEAKSAVSTLEKAGFYARQASDEEVCVYTQYEDSEQAIAHVQRILSEKDIEIRNESLAVGVIHGGKVVFLDEEFAEDLAAAVQESEMGQPSKKMAFDLEDFGATVNEAGYGDIEPDDGDDMDEMGMMPYEQDDDMMPDDEYAEQEYDDYFEQDDDENGDDENGDDEDDEDDDEEPEEQYGHPPVVDDPEDLDLDLDVNDEEPEDDWGGGYEESAQKAYYRNVPWRYRGQKQGHVKLWFNSDDKLVEVRGFDNAGNLLAVRSVAEDMGAFMAGLWGKGPQARKWRKNRDPKAISRMRAEYAKGQGLNQAAARKGKRVAKKKKGKRAESVNRILKGIVNEAIETKRVPLVEKATTKQPQMKRRTVGKTVRRRGAANESAQVRFLQDEIARLESENQNYRELLDAAADVQRQESIDSRVSEIIACHPKLAKVKNKLTKCATIEQVDEEAQSLLAILGESESAKSSKTEFKVATAVGNGNGSTTSTPSTKTEGVPTSPVAGSPATSFLSESKSSDTASRVAAYRRRQRQKNR